MESDFLQVQELAAQGEDISPWSYLLGNAVSSGREDICEFLLSHGLDGHEDFAWIPGATMLSGPRVYADFLKSIPSPRNPEQVSLVLTTFGTVADLTRHKIRLQQGMALTFYTDSDENEDLEVEGTIFYQPGLRLVDAPRWVADIVWDLIRDVPARRPLGVPGFPCFRCDLDLTPHFEREGRTERTCCPSCGTSIMEVVAPPPSP